MFSGHTAAILRAQWQSILNQSFKPGHRFASAIMLVWYLIWYGAWSFGAWLVFRLTADIGAGFLMSMGQLILFGVFVYWQLVPLLLVGAGLSLDLKRLRVYPVPESSLFGIEAALRLTTAPEMALIALGLIAGCLWNTELPWWAPLPVLAFTAFNLLLSIGVRDLFSRLINRKGTRELLVLLIVLLMALPQILLVQASEVNDDLARHLRAGKYTPWNATAALAAGEADVRAAGALLGWVVLGWWFGRRQFARSLRFDQAAVRSRERMGNEARRGVAERLASAASAIFRDPLGALLQKEILVLSRSARFRLLFIMGFTFGLLIFLPMASGGATFIRQNYLTVVTAYSIMLLGEVCFWNSFGIDRSAAQAYFVMPVGLRAALMAKNFAGVMFVLLEVLIVALVCSVLRFPVTAASIAEALAVSAVILVFLLACGNLLSVRFPRGIDPGQSWRGGAVGKVQGYLLLLYPVLSAPIFLAYGARYAFDDSDAAFYGVLFVDFLIGLLVYSIALESAAGTAERRRERLLEALGTGEGPAAG